MRKNWFSTFILLACVCAFTFGEASATAAGWTQKQFLITFWLPPPATDENLARVAAEGFNLTWTPQEGLDVAARHGLRAMLISNLLNPATLDDKAKRAQLDALIDSVKNHPALEAYYLKDEPGAGEFPALGKLVAYLRERDPAHVAYINLYPTYANERGLGVTVDAISDDKTVLLYREYLRQFIETVHPDLLSYDHYHFMKKGDNNEYFLNLGMIRKAALDANRPFLNIIQADMFDKSWRLPNATEMRWLVFTTMAYGGRGISYFTYWGPKSYNGLYQDGKPAPLLKDVVALNMEIAKFGPALMELDSVGVYHTTPLPYGAEAIPVKAPVQIKGDGQFVLGLFGKDSLPTAFMIVNRNYKQETEATVTVAIPGSELQELDRKTGKWVLSETLSGKRTVKIKLAPGDGRLFRVSK